MIKIISYFCIQEIPLIKGLVLNSASKCNKFRFLNNKLYQKPRDSDDWVVCEIYFQKTHLDEGFYEYVVSTIMNAHRIVPSIKTSDPNESQTYGTKIEGKIENTVYALLDKIFYANKENADFGIFDFVASLLYRIVKAHAFHNGNKRTAILSISYLLNAFGYYIVWSSDSEIYVKVWEELMIYIASSSGIEHEVTAKIKEKLVKATWLKL